MNDRQAGRWGRTLHGRDAGRFPSDASFDPTALNLSLYQRASFAGGGGNWPGTASAGSSGAHSLIDFGFPPSVGTAVNGFNPVKFAPSGGAGTGSGSSLEHSVTEDQIFVNGGTAMSGWLLLFLDSTGLAGQLMRGSPSGDYGMSWPFGATISCDFPYQAHPGVANSVDVNTASSATDVWMLLQWRCGPTTVEARVNGDAWQTTSFAADTIAGSSSDTGLLANPFGGGTFSVLEYAIGNITMTDANFDSLRMYCNTRYALSV